MTERLKIAGMVALTLVAVLVLSALLVGTETAAPAQMSRQVQLPVTALTDPVAFTRVALGETVVQRGRFIRLPEEPPTQFLGDDDWIQNLTIYLLNRTNKPIVYAAINFIFPETLDYVAHTGAACQVVLGRIPQSGLFDRSGKPLPNEQEPLQPIQLNPGETMAIRLGDHIDKFKTYIDPVRPLAALTKMEVRPVTLFFDDGMEWAGAYRAFDGHGSTWRKMNRDYFPGLMDRYVPGKPGWIDR